MPVGSTSQRSVQVSGFADIGLLTPLRRLISASCSSGQRFAYSFLRIRSRPRHPCRSADTSPCRVCRGLSPPSTCALPGAPNKKPAQGGLLGWIERCLVRRARSELLIGRGFHLHCYLLHRVGRKCFRDRRCWHLGCCRS